MHAFSFIFIFLRRIVLNIPNLNGINCTPKLCKKEYRSPRWLKSWRQSFLFTRSINLKKILCSRNARAYSPDNVIFMHSRGCAVQYWGITLKWKTRPDKTDGIIYYIITKLLTLISTDYERLFYSERTYQTLSSARRTFVFLGSRCARPLTPRNAHALRCEFSKWRTGQRVKLKKQSDFAMNTQHTPPLERWIHGREKQNCMILRSIWY